MNRARHHGHHHAGPNFHRAFAWGVLLNLVFVAVEVVFGVLADSLALLTDAGHNLSDVLGLLLAWGASALAQRRPSPRRTYGYSRATILASLGSSLLLLGAVGAITWEAINRLLVPSQPVGLIMMVVATVGVVINTATALLFLGGKDHDLNIRGAYLHMLADAGVSVGVVVAGALVWWLGWPWMDPLVSIGIAIAIFASTLGLLRDSLNLAVDAVPRNVDPEAVRDFLLQQAEVTGLHDLHIWGMSTTDTALTAHLVMRVMPDSDEFLNRLSEALQERFGIEHATIQMERAAEGANCQLAGHCGG